MTGSKATGRGTGALKYRLAEALWGVTGPESRAEAEKALEAVSRALQASPRLRQLLIHPGIELEAKMGLLESIAALPGPVRELVEALVVRRSLAAAGGVLRAYRSLAERRSPEVRATVLVPEALSVEEAEQVRGVLEKSLGKRVKLSVRTRRDLLGGLLIQVGETIVDGTVKGALDRLERRLVQAAGKERA